MGRRLGLAALLLAMAGPAVAADQVYRSTRPKIRPSVAASCSGFTMLQADQELPGTANGNASGAANGNASGAVNGNPNGTVNGNANGIVNRRVARAPAWRSEGLRQYLRYYRTACPDADALPLRHAAAQADAR
jgi:hypothetical protein